ncbi:autotransporter outer membrane beta-barrel domain-containing protein [Sutterella sp. AM11-39]|uniref:autotransporter outer membrane beta-barrel domain-containing protein n=1 Tax=Sutterella sp. AM11-39 TaxID=2292075 RepID=UPI000E53C7D8|nr:autotransporter outer membrane beta-barrel domain-containing protein [Sutterella sp. AM11-39]RHJ34691.1 autotransporter outer membrane beta-barrel domain-containing protein [Sutterella sp. AM11-39]
MPRFYLTAVAAAVMAATVNAAEFPAIPTDQTDYNEIIYRDDANDPTSYEQSSWNGIGLVASGEPMSSGSKAPAFLSTAKGDIVTNNGSIWVLADRIPGNKLGQYASGILASGGKKGVNAEGAVIYVHSDNNGKEDNYEAAKGMAADASTGTKTSITNSGTIYVEGGTGMLATSNPKPANALSSEKGSVITNEGTIHVINSGFGMSLGGNDASGVKMTNEGTIIASGKNAYGITASDAKDGTVTNEGTIIATDGAIAISSGRWDKDVDFRLILKGNSHVEGVIELGKGSELTVENLARAETIVLSSGTPEKVNALDGDPCEDCNVGSVHVNNSNLTIRSSDESQTLKIGLIETVGNGSLTFEFDSVGSKEKPLLDVDTGGQDDAVKFNYTGTVSDKLASGSVKAEELFNGISLDNNATPERITTSDGLWGGASVHEKKDDEITSTYSGPSSLITSTTDLALMNGLVWRSQLTNLSDRMGTLRTMPQAAGAWARYNNGRLDGRGLEYDYSTIEVGFDAPVSSNFLVGVSFDYTIGDTDLNAGSADNDVYTLGLYGTYYGDNGGFVDLMAKIGRIDNEYNVANSAGSEKGDYMMTGAIVGVEAGHRFDLAHNMFVEPQVQLSYSWLRATDYATNIRSVDFETIESLVARVGVMGGMKFAENRGAAYLKASYNHDFLGSVDAAMHAVNGSNNSAKISDELDDNWAEVSLGVSYSVTDTLNTFLDVGTGFGGDIDQKWRINFGARYAF